MMKIMKMYDLIVWLQRIEYSAVSTERSYYSYFFMSDVYLGFKVIWIPYLPACNRLLKFTSSVTPADLLIASMIAEPFLSTYL